MEIFSIQNRKRMFLPSFVDDGEHFTKKLAPKNQKQMRESLVKMILKRDLLADMQSQNDFFDMIFSRKGWYIFRI